MNIQKISSLQCKHVKRFIKVNTAVVWGGWACYLGGSAAHSHGAVSQTHACGLVDVPVTWNGAHAKPTQNLLHA